MKELTNSALKKIQELRNSTLKKIILTRLYLSSLYASSAPPPPSPFSLSVMNDVIGLEKRVRAQPTAVM